jgi:hypothetical protein
LETDRSKEEALIGLPGLDTGSFCLCVKTELWRQSYTQLSAFQVFLRDITDNDISINSKIFEMGIPLNIETVLPQLSES